MNLKKIEKVFTSKSVGTRPSSYKKRIYRAAVTQRVRNTDLGYDVAISHTFSQNGLLMYISVNKQLINFQNYLGVLFQLCQGKGKVTLSHFISLRGQCTMCRGQHVTRRLRGHRVWVK